MSKNYARSFYKPVDAKKLNLSDYHNIIKTPIDLSTIKKKMDDRKYESASEFVADISLMLSNCYQYNPRTHKVVEEGLQLQALFEKHLQKWQKKFAAEGKFYGAK